MAIFPKSNMGRYLLAIPFVIVGIYVLFLLLNDEVGSLLADIANPGLAILVAVLAFALYWTTKKTASPEINLGLVVVFSLFALGELTWSVYVEILGEDLNVSIADLFWLLGYLVLVGLLFQVSKATGAVKSKSVVLVELAFWLLISPVLVYLLVTSLQSTDLSTLEIITWNLYTALDAMILSMLILLLWAFRKGLLEDCWTIVAVAFVFMTVGDLLFTIYEAAGSSPVGSLSDVFYIGTYALLAFGFGLVLISRTRSARIAPVRITFDQLDEARLLVPRTTYIVWEADSRRAYELMVKGLTAGLDVMIVSAKQPTSIRPTFGIKHTEIYWLTTSTGDKVIHPANTGILIDTITRFMQKGPKTLVLLDGFELIVTYGDFKKALVVIDHLEDIVSTTSSRLIIPINKHAFSEKEIAQIEKYAVVIQ